MNWIQLIAYYVLLIALTAATLPSHSVTDWIKVENITSTNISIVIPTTLATAKTTPAITFPYPLYVHLSNKQLSDCYFRKSQPNMFKIRCFNADTQTQTQTQVSQKTELFCIHLSHGFMCI